MTGMSALPALTHRLDRTIVIEAPRDIVFGFFVDEKRWATWWGAGSTTDPKPGGRLLIRYPDGTEALGEVLEIDAPERIVFTYGYASGKMIAPGGSRVTIRLEADARGTRLHFMHEFAEASVRDMHVQGWRYHLSLFSNVVSNELHANAASAVDEWFGAWTEEDAAKRRQRLAAIAAPGVRFRDRFSLIDGIGEVNDQIGAAQRFMPGIRMERRGDVRQCQGTVLADWVALTKDNQERGRGTNIYSFGPNGKIESVVGFWAS
ncbi:MAG: SRPBCC domain-containing protein [Acidobacteria bacterium]|nr:SRPBCC domain-containing protein [Acidobacteriota bacterium]